MRDLLVADLRRNVGRQIEPPKQAIALYHWLATAQGGSRTTPRVHIRSSIERITAGAVPLDSWTSPGSTEVAA